MKYYLTSISLMLRFCFCIKSKFEELEVGKFGNFSIEPFVSDIKLKNNIKKIESEKRRIKKGSKKEKKNDDSKGKT